MYLIGKGGILLKDFIFENFVEKWKGKNYDIIVLINFIIFKICIIYIKIIFSSIEGYIN